MNSQFRHVALVGRYHAAAPSATAGVLEALRNTLTELAQFLHRQGCDVSIEAETANHVGMVGYAALDAAAIGAACDLALVLGGDGTVLGIGRQLAPFDVPLIGLNQGRLGFMTDIALNAFQSVLAPMLRGDFEEDRRSLMNAKVLRDSRCVFDALAMNEVVVNRGGSSGMLELRVEVNGHFVANHRVDGLIVATPTGSTAYALAAGGPLLHPTIAGWVLVPIAPHSLSNRSIVLADQAEVTIELVAGRDASANFDMQSLASLLHGDRISVRRSQHLVRFLHPRGWSYFDTLRKKLHWNEGVS